MIPDRWSRTIRWLIVPVVVVIAAILANRSFAQFPVAILADAHAASDPAPKRSANRLIHEKSPYLLQHAHNPVDWYPWGAEAFEKAKREDKPVFLSVGYSTCYWCHVMEKQSFEDDEVAKILNEHFVAIKVDREERPDVDEQYMIATQLFTGRGGWPNSVWLTPEGKPWMAGTYFPKTQFISALRQLAGIWKDKRAEANRQADAVAAAIAESGSVDALAGGHTGELSGELVESAVATFAGRFVPENGGFGAAPKFPPHGVLRLLLRQYRDKRDEALLPPIAKTLDAMWLGGMHDHIGGGFHRYSTDMRWLLPHFEKMLYDNAQLMRNYTDGFLVTKRGIYREAVEDIFRWVQRDMTSPQGAFYSAIDSGDVGKEGEAYVWHTEQVDRVLGADDGALFAALYNFERRGNFAEEATGMRSGANIPHLLEPVDELARKRDEEPVAFAARVGAMRDRLLAERQTWPQPHKDDKILTGWNGLMIASLAYAGRQLDEPRYTKAARRAVGFILGTMMRDGRLLRTYRDGKAKLPGYLDDHAYLADGLIELYRATGEARWLDEADRLGAALVRDFEDTADGAFFFTAGHHEDLLIRSKSLGGGGNVPDPNGVAVQVLLDLARLTGRTEYRGTAGRALRSLAGLMQHSPFASEHLLVAAADFLREAPGPRRDSAIADADVPAGAPAQADVERRAEAVRIRAFASRLGIRPGESMSVAVILDIDDGWHLYGDNPEAEFLLATTVEAKPAANVSIGAIARPEPHRALDPIVNMTLNTYTGRIRFDVPVTVAADAPAGAVTLALTVHTQPCDASRCLPAQATELLLPLQIDPEASTQSRHPALFARIDD